MCVRPVNGMVEGGNAGLVEKAHAARWPDVYSWIRFFSHDDAYSAVFFLFLF